MSKLTKMRRREVFYDLFESILGVSHMEWGDFAIQEKVDPNDSLSTDLALLSDRENLPEHEINVSI